MTLSSVRLISIPPCIKVWNISGLQFALYGRKRHVTHLILINFRFKRPDPNNIDNFDLWEVSLKYNFQHFQVAVRKSAIRFPYFSLHFSFVALPNVYNLVFSNRSHFLPEFCLIFLICEWISRGPETCLKMLSIELPIARFRVLIITRISTYVVKVKWFVYHISLFDQSMTDGMVTQINAKFASSKSTLIHTNLYRSSSKSLLLNQKGTLNLFLLWPLVFPPKLPVHIYRTPIPGALWIFLRLLNTFVILKATYIRPTKSKRQTVSLRQNHACRDIIILIMALRFGLVVRLLFLSVIFMLLLKLSC